MLLVSIRVVFSFLVKVRVIFINFQQVVLLGLVVLFQLGL